MGLRILLVIDSYFPGTGGTERQLAQLAPRLKASGHHVEILCPRLLPSMSLREDFNGIPVRRVAYPRFRKIGAFILLLKMAGVLLRRYRRYDVIHVHIVNNIAPVIGALRPFLRARLVAKVSGATELSGGLLDPTLSKKPATIIRNYFVRRFHFMQVISRETREALIRAGYDRSGLIEIPNGVNTGTFAAGDRRRAHGKKTTAVYAGRLRRVKGVDILLHAWARVVARCEAELIILGDGEEYDKLLELATTLRISDRVTFVGDCRDIAPYLRRSDVYVQPSRQEGLPNAVIEAMAAGLPVVATRVGGNRDLVVDGETGLLVDSESSDELATAICALLADADTRLRMGSSASRYAIQNYSMDSVISRLLQLYTSSALEVAAA
jgi:glycosyltransferase involved in cell wall biosynthesis